MRVTTSAREVVGLWAMDSLKFPALSPFWNSPTNIYLVGIDDLNSCIIKECEIFPQRFRWALVNVKDGGGEHLYVPTCFKKMNQILIHVMVADDREPWQVHVSP